MKTKFKLVCLFISFSVFYANPIFAQIKAKTEMGVVIYLFEDGTWSGSKVKPKTNKAEPSDLKNEKTNECKSTVRFKNVEVVDKVELTANVIPDENVTIATLKLPTKSKAEISVSGISIEFENDEIIDLSNDAKSEKNGNFTSYFGSAYKKEEELDLLQKVKIKRIKIRSANFEMSHLPSAQEKAAVLEAFNCK